MERVRQRLKQENEPFLENDMSRSELLANGKMTIFSFDTPIFNRRSGTLYSSQTFIHKNYNRKRDFS